MQLNSVDYANDDIIYTMGPGTGYAGAHQQTICIFHGNAMELTHQQFTQMSFNGPFEITEKDRAHLMLKSTGAN